MLYYIILYILVLINMHKLNINNLNNSFFNKEEYIDKCLNGWKLCLEFHYLSCFENTKILRDFINIICKKFNVSEKNTWRFILVTDEMNNNAIEYWTSSWYENIIRIIVKSNWEKLYFVIEVEDKWNWEKHKTAKEMEELKNNRLKTWFNVHTSIRWRWLFMIIINIVDKLYFIDSKKWWLIVGIEKEITIEK